MRYLKKFLEFRSREELIKYCKEHKIIITEEQIEGLRRNFNETFNTDKKLNIESLDKISGGMRTANSDFVKPKPPDNRTRRKIEEGHRSTSLPTILPMTMPKAQFEEALAKIPKSPIQLPNPQWPPDLRISEDTYTIVEKHFGHDFSEKTTLNDVINFLMRVQPGQN